MDDTQEKIGGLTIRYVCGEISEIVYRVSLMGLCSSDEIKHLLILNQQAHRNSLPFKRGDVT
jgi:hypothetical protein